MKTFLLPSKLRLKLKKPLGLTIIGKRWLVVKKYQKFIQKNKFKKIITIGDVCSATLFSHVKIFDAKIKRRKIKKKFKFSFCLINPASTIQKTVWPIMKKAFKNNKNIFVVGEEDLLTIPSVLLAPKNSLVVYGLPNKGIVLIRTSKRTKKRFKNLLKKFKTL